MIFSIDIKTVMYMLILGHLFTGVILISYSVQHKKDRSINIFLMAKLIQLIAWTAISLRNIIPDIISIPAGNSLLYIGTTLELIAFLVLKNSYNRIIKFFYIALVIISIMVFNIIYIYLNNDYIRIAASSLIVAVLWTYPIFKLLTDKSSSILQRVISILYGFTIITLLLRAYFSIKLGPNMEFLGSSLYNSLTFLPLYIVMLIGSTGFILLAKERLDLELYNAATFDELTAAFNRRTFILQAKQMISLFSRKNEPLSFLLIDIDNFKRINDTYGHYIGDVALKEFAARIKAQLRDCDLFGRFGGEEFAVLLSGTDEKKSLVIAERLRKTIEDSLVSTKHEIKYTISIGAVTMTPNEKTTVDMFYRLSDKALYRAKMQGRNCIVNHEFHK